MVALYDMEESCCATATVGNGGTRLSKTVLGGQQDMGCMECRHIEGKLGTHERWKERESLTSAVILF